MTAAEPVPLFKAASVLLQYPDAARREAAAELREAPIEGGGRRPVAALRSFAAWYSETPLGALERLYVESFDFAKGSSLHLTYHVHGDSRRRGMALLRLKAAYREAGFEPPGDELPDYLPLLLEFAALVPPAVGATLLEEHRVSIELVRASLRRDESRFAPLLDVVAGSLPKLTRAKLARVRRLAAEGPPHEEVGLEPFAPPEVMPPTREGIA